MTSADASRSCSGRRPAKTASRIMPSIRGLAAMSLALLNPIPDWLALRVACVMLSSVRPGKSRSKDPLPNFIVNRRDFATMDPQDVVDTTDPRTLSEEGELRLPVLAELDALVRGSDDVCLAQELVRDKLPRPNRNSERDAAVGDCKVLAKLRTSPILHSGGAASRSFTWWTTSVFRGFRSAPTPVLATSKSWRKYNTRIGMAHDVTVIHVLLVRQAFVCLQRVPRIMSTGELFWHTKLESSAT